MAIPPLALVLVRTSAAIPPFLAGERYLLRAEEAMELRDAGALDLEAGIEVPEQDPALSDHVCAALLEAFQPPPVVEAPGEPPDAEPVDPPVAEVP
jgi:hypothetical protein